MWLKYVSFLAKIEILAVVICVVVDLTLEFIEYWKVQKCIKPHK